MSRYFEKAMRHNPDIDLKTTGVFTGSWIPWLGGVNLPEKYSLPPDLPLPFRPDVGKVSYSLVKAQLGDWVPDIVLSIDAGINWIEKPSDGIVATIATDPHALDYSHQRKISDKFFNMQLSYSEPKDVYLPYAYSKYDHYPLPHLMSDTDAILIGMPYPQRVEWVNKLKNAGVSVIFENSPVFDEYRDLASRARVGLNWSSLNDLNARFFETPAFGLAMVTNRLPDASQFLVENEDYLGFSGLDEAVEKVLYLKNNEEERVEIARSGYKKIQPHTYDARIKQFLTECGYA